MPDDDTTTTENPQDADQDTSTPPAGDPPAAEDKPLGEGGEKALKAERDARRKAESAQKELAEKLKEFEDRDKSEVQRLTDRLAEAEQTAATATGQALRYRIASAHQISDEDAETFLTGSDEESLTRQAERLVALRGESKRFQGSADGGARPGPQTPSQLTRDDLRGMSPDQVVAAKEAGQLRDLLGTQ